MSTDDLKPASVFERPNTVSRPDLLVDGSDFKFRQMIYEMDHLSHLIQDTRRNISQSLNLSPPEFNALMGIAQLQGDIGVSVGDLARHLRVAGPFATQQANHLQKRGLVSKTANPKDKRSTLLKLTDAGEVMFRDLAPTLQRLNDRIFSGLSRDDFHQFCTLLERVASGWTQTQLSFEAETLE